MPKSLIGYMKRPEGIEPSLKPGKVARSAGRGSQWGRQSKNLEAVNDSRATIKRA